MKPGFLQTLIIAAFVTGLYSATVAAEGGIEVGVLTCNVVPGSRVNLLIRSTADVECTYENGGSGAKPASRWVWI